MSYYPDRFFCLFFFFSFFTFEVLHLNVQQSNESISLTASCEWVHYNEVNETLGRRWLEVRRETFLVCGTRT